MFIYAWSLVKTMEQSLVNEVRNLCESFNSSYINLYKTKLVHRCMETKIMMNKGTDK